MLRRNIAVKAIIFRADGKILLQRRDFTNHIPYPGSWNFFGGYVEGNENLLQALERELNEEIGCVPGIIENEIFQWESNTESTINHFFPIFFNAKENPFYISRQQMFILKSLVTIKKIPVFRVCLHTNDSADIHEMIMIHSKPSKVGPLKQLKTSLSYHIIEGELAIELFDEKGTKLKEYIVSNSNLNENVNSSIRLNAKQFRTVSSVSPFAIFLEVGSGPFQDSDTIWLKN